MVTWLDEQDVSEAVQRDLLHHTPQDVTSVHYRRSKGSDRLKKAWQMWGDHVSELVCG